ncbi:hypothetical protein J7K06_01140 [Candidatus Bathyarchaeota archaeon]|nr:hypothetical protein [Candidatus Bathyarchaeota archaeon]
MKLQQFNKAFHFKTLSKDAIFIGSPDAADFKPQFLLKRWQNECHIKLSVGTTAKNLKFNEENNCVVWESELFTVKAYPKDKTVSKVNIREREISYELNELGGLEFELILKTKPSTNTLTFPMKTQNLKFYFQPPLTEELNPNEYDEITETYAVKNGRVIVFRPPEVVGSYAAYHATKTNMHRSKEDAEKYKVGKAFHIYRPEATNANGNTVWCDLKVDEKKGLLTVTVPQEFLDKAVYPVTIDPTFGYTEVGGSQLNMHGWAMATNRQQITEGSGTAESVSIYTTSSDWHVRVAIYDDNAGNPNNLLWESPSTLGASGDWLTISTSSVNITQGEYYWLGLQHDVNGGMVKGDYVEPGYSKYREQSYGAFPDPFGTPDGGQPYRFSIYCTYTAEAGATQVTITDSAVGSEQFSRLYRNFKVSDQASSQEIFSRPQREIPFADKALSQEIINKTRNLTFSDIATGLESIKKARHIGAVTDVAEGLEHLLKQRLIALSEHAVGSEIALRPTRVTVVADEALSQEILSKLREVATITDSAIGVEILSSGATSQTAKTKIFLLIGDIAIQITGD